MWQGRVTWDDMASTDGANVRRPQGSWRHNQTAMEEQTVEHATQQGKITEGWTRKVDRGANREANREAVDREMLWWC